MKNEKFGETDNIGYTRPRKTKQKHNTIWVRYHYAQTNAHNVNKTWDPLQTTVDKDDPNHRLYAEIVTDIELVLVLNITEIPLIGR
jgi:hypothetical protein